MIFEVQRRSYCGRHHVAELKPLYRHNSPSAIDELVRVQSRMPLRLTGSSVLVIRAMRYASSSSSVTSVLVAPQETACFLRLSLCHSSSSSPPLCLRFSDLRAAASLSLSKFTSPSPRPCLFLDEACSCCRSASLRSRSDVAEDRKSDGAVLSNCSALDASLASIPAAPVQYEFDIVEWQHAKPH